MKNMATILTSKFSLLKILGIGFLCHCIRLVSIYTTVASFEMLIKIYVLLASIYKPNSQENQACTNPICNQVMMSLKRQPFQALIERVWKFLYRETKAKPCENPHISNAQCSFERNKAHQTCGRVTTSNQSGHIMLTHTA